MNSARIMNNSYWSILFFFSCCILAGKVLLSYQMVFFAQGKRQLGVMLFKESSVGPSLNIKPSV